MSCWCLPIVCGVVFQRHCKLFGSLNALSMSYILTGFDTSSPHTLLGLISLSWFPAMELFSLSLVLCAGVTSHAASGPSSLWNLVLGMRVLGICYPNCAASDTTVHLRCLKNSASQLSCALRKYFLSFMEQQSEMPNIMKEVCGAAGKWTLISPCLSCTLITWSSPLPHLKFLSWSWTSMSNCIFHLFSLASAYGLRHWRTVEFLHVGSLLQYCSFMFGVFFNTVLLSPLFLLPFLHPKLCEIKSLFPSTSQMQFSVFVHILAVKSFISVLCFSAVTRFFFLDPHIFPPLRHSTLSTQCSLRLQSKSHSLLF